MLLRIALHYQEVCIFASVVTVCLTITKENLSMKNFRSLLAVAAIAALSFGTAFAGGDKCKDKDCCKTKAAKTSKKADKSTDKTAETKKS